MKEHLFPSHIAQVNGDCDLRKRGRKEGLSGCKKIVRQCVCVCVREDSE